LVPFGEYVPWHFARSIIPALDRELPTDAIAGKKLVAFHVGTARVGTLICFESTYPELARGLARDGAQILIVTTNDASFGTSPAAREHLAMSQTRAVELGRAVVHAAISGISAVIPRVLASTPDVDILVAYDNSPDGTGKLADDIAAREQRVRVLHRPGKAGLGPAYVAGFKDALARGYDAVIEMDADLSHSPEDIPRLIDAAATADVVLGSRYAPGGGTRNW